MRKVIISFDVDKEVHINHIDEFKYYAFQHEIHGRSFLRRKKYHSFVNSNQSLNEDDKYMCITPGYLTIGDGIDFIEGIGLTLESAIRYIMNKFKFQVYEFDSAQEMFRWISEG